MSQKKKGVLILADVVGFTSQAHKLGQKNTEKFLEHYESKIKEIAAAYNANYIKRIGDAVLLFHEDEDQSLELMKAMWQNSRKNIFSASGMRGVRPAGAPPLQRFMPALEPLGSCKSLPAAAGSTFPTQRSFADARRTLTPITIGL